MTDDRKGFFHRTAVVLGFADDDRIEGRSELPIWDGSVLSPSRSNYDTVVTADRALSLAAVYRAVHILGTSVSQLPVGVWRQGVEIDAPTIVKQPNLDLSLSAFLEQTVNSLALSGNAYWLLHKSSPQAAVGSIEVLNPHACYPTTDDKSGRLVYRYGDKTYQKWQIKHLWLMRVPGMDKGLGPIQAAQNELRGAIDLRDYSENWFRSGDVPTGILSTDKPLAPEMADAYASRWEQAGGKGGRRVRVLGQGLNYQPIYLSPADAQFLESQTFSVTQIARLFGIPASYMLAAVESQNMTYSNLEMVDTQFVRYTLMSYLKEIESALTDVLVRGQEARFKVEGLLRADQATRYGSYNIAITAGFMTVEEVRAKEGLSPLPASAKPSAPVATENTNEEEGVNA